MIQYKRITHIGSHLKMKETKRNSHKVVSNLNMVDISKRRNRIFCMTTTVGDILSAFPHTIIIPSANRYGKYMHQVQPVQNDGIVLLFNVILLTKSIKYNIELDHDFSKNIKRVKDSTINKTVDYNGSICSYYSFGENAPISKLGILLLVNLRPK